MYEFGLGVEKDSKEAVRLLRLSAEQGFLYAQNNLGYMYENGLGVEKDLKEAVRLYRLSADQGNDTGKYYLNTLINYLKSL